MFGRKYGASGLPEAVTQAFSKQADASPGTIVQSTQGEFLLRADAVGNGWRLLSAADLRAGNQEIRALSLNVLRIGLFLLALSSLMIIAVSRQLTVPVRKLAAHMVSAGDSLPDAVPVPKGRDEFSILSANFNTMIWRNRQLLDRVREEQTQHRHLELALLQAQIKPHFLYNTLNAIHSLIGERQYRVARRAIELMVAHYRFVLNSGSEWVSAAEEIRNARNYLEIQQIRSSEELAYTVEIPADLNAFRMPKLTLQPLLENAILHGIRPARRPGQIRITGDMNDEGIDLHVWDNGVGIPPEKMDILLRDDQTQTPASGFGLKNVHDRLRLYYGEGSGLTLQQGPEGGTTVTVHMILSTGIKETTPNALP